MKKFASLVLAALMLATMLTVFAVPASAAGEPVEISASQLNKISCNSIIKEPGEYEVESIAIYHNVKLIIGEGVTIKVATAFVNKGTIEVLGTLDISQCGGTGRERIIIGDTGELIDWYDENDAVAGNGEGIDIPPSSFSSMLSQGSLTIICTVSAAVVFGLGGFFLGTKKKKKTAVADGENKDEE